MNLLTCTGAANVLMHVVCILVHLMFRQFRNRLLGNVHRAADLERTRLQRDGDASSIWSSPAHSHACSSSVCKHDPGLLGAGFTRSCSFALLVEP
jgi:hypothetical protein